MTRDKYANTCHNFETGFNRNISLSHKKTPKRQNAGVCCIHSVTAAGRFLSVLEFVFMHFSGTPPI